MRRLLLSALLFAPTAALAVPMQFTHQGVISDISGPLQGSQDVTFTIYDAPASGTQLWTETLNLDFTDGVYASLLGNTTPLDTAMFDTTDALFMGITVGSGAELPARVPLKSVPYALVAGHAETAAAAESVSGGGVVDASEIQVNGTTVIDSSGNIDYSSITNAPPDTLGALSCGSGEIAVYDGVDWQCGTANNHQHDAVAINTGTIDIARLPVGNGSSEVAPGDHLHSADDVSTGVFDAARIPTLDGAIIGSGTVAAAYLPVGTTAADVAAGNHDHDGDYLSLADLSAADAGTLTGGGDADTLHTHAAEANPWVACGDLSDFATNSCEITGFPSVDYEYGYAYNSNSIHEVICTYWNNGQKLYNKHPYMTYTDNPDIPMRWGGAMFYRGTSAASDDGCNGTTQWRHGYWNMDYGEGSTGGVNISGSNGCVARTMYCRERR